MSFVGQIALVTGASRGIGQAIARHLSEAGARVIGTATTEAGAQAIHAELSAYGGAGRCIDVRNADAVDALVEQITKEFGPIQILVNNAGVTRDNLLMRMKPEEWDTVIDTDLSAVFRLSKAVIRGMMKARYGRIISVGSVVGTMGNAGQANYCAAKAGLIGFSKALAKEVGSRGITVNVVAPGFIDTDMTKALPDASKAALLEAVPAARLGTPEDIATAVVFLSSKTASYINGVTLHVNGGLHMD